MEMEVLHMKTNNGVGVLGKIYWKYNVKCLIVKSAHTSYNTHSWRICIKALKVFVCELEKKG